MGWKLLLLIVYKTGMELFTNWSACEAIVFSVQVSSDTSSVQAIAMVHLQHDTPFFIDLLLPISYTLHHGLMCNIFLRYCHRSDSSMDEKECIYCIPNANHVLAWETDIVHVGPPVVACCSLCYVWCSYGDGKACAPFSDFVASKQILPVLEDERKM